MPISTVVSHVRPLHRMPRHMKAGKHITTNRSMDSVIPSVRYGSRRTPSAKSDTENRKRQNDQIVSARKHRNQPPVLQLKSRNGVSVTADTNRSRKVPWFQ